MGYTWVKEYFSTKSLNYNRKIWSILLVFLSFLMFCGSIYIDPMGGNLLLLGFSISYLLLHFGLGFRIGKGMQYFLFNLVILSIVAIITYFYNNN